MSDADDRPQRIRACLETAFSPARLELIDDSHRHAGHAGAREGGHFVLRIAAPAFAGKRPLECHRMIYAALGELMHTDIHALSIELLPPGLGEPLKYSVLPAAQGRAAKISGRQLLIL